MYRCTESELPCPSQLFMRRNDTIFLYNKGYVMISSKDGKFTYHGSIGYPADELFYPCGIYCDSEEYILVTDLKIHAKYFS